MLGICTIYPLSGVRRIRSVCSAIAGCFTGSSVARCPWCCAGGVAGTGGTRGSREYGDSMKSRQRVLLRLSAGCSCRHFEMPNGLAGKLVGGDERCGNSDLFFIVR